MFSRLSSWIWTIISFLLVLFCYIFIPSVLGNMTNGWGILALIFILPFMIAFGLCAVGSVLMSVIKAILSRKWYLIVLNVMIVIFAIFTSLTCVGIFDSVI